MRTRMLSRRSIGLRAATAADQRAFRLKEPTPSICRSSEHPIAPNTGYRRCRPNRLHLELRVRPQEEDPNSDGLRGAIEKLHERRVLPDRL